MNQKKDLLEPLLPPFWAGLVLLAVFARADLWPFGTGTLAWGDMSQQVVPLMMELRDALTGNGSLFYSHGNAGGMNFWGVLFYYLASPFSVLSVLFERSEMLYFMNLLTFFKITAASETAWLFFRFRFPSLSWMERTVLSVSYAFCGYSMMFYQITGWLDSMILFPLLLWSFLRLLDGGPVLFFAVMLALVVVTNYYISYCVILFLIFASGILLVLTKAKAERRLTAARLGLGALTAMLLSAFVWLPSFLQYLDSARTAELSSGPVPLLAPIHTTWALLFCSAVPFAVLPFVYRAEECQSRRRLPFRILMVLLLIPSFWEPVNRIWHTGDYQAFPIRYGFLTVFTGLVLTAEILTASAAGRNEAQPESPAVLCCAAGTLILPAAAGMILLSVRYDEITAFTRRLSETAESYSLLFLFFAAMTVSCFLLFFLYRSGMLGRRSFSFLLAALVLLEGGFHSLVYLGSAARQTAWFPWVTDLAGKIEDSEFYRVKTESKLFDVNLTGAVGYPTISHYTSLSGKRVRKGLAELGYSSYWMEIGSHGGTLLTDWLLGNRYQIERSDTESRLPERISEIIYDNGGYRISRLLFPAPLFTVPEDALISDIPEGGRERAMLGEQILSRLTGRPVSLVKKRDPDGLLGASLTVQEDGTAAVQPNGSAPGYLTWRFRLEEDAVLYFDCFDQPGIRLSEPYYHSLRLIVNGEERTEVYPSQSENGLVDLGTYSAGERVEITAVVKRPVSVRSFGVYSLSVKGFEELCGSFSPLALRRSKSGWEGVVSSGDEGLWAVLPIPYENGLSAEVNGQPAEPKPAFGLFTAIPLERGTNQIQIAFTPPGFRVGLLLSLLGLALLVIVKLAGEKTVNRFLGLAGAPAFTLLGLLWAAALWEVYLLPTISALADRFW